MSTIKDETTTQDAIETVPMNQRPLFKEEAVLIREALAFRIAFGEPLRAWHTARIAESTANARAAAEPGNNEVEQAWRDARAAYATATHGLAAACVGVFGTGER